MGFGYDVSLMSLWLPHLSPAAEHNELYIMNYIYNVACKVWLCVLDDVPVTSSLVSLPTAEPKGLYL